MGHHYQDANHGNRMMSSWYKSEAHFLAKLRGGSYLANGNGYGDGHKASNFTFGSWAGQAEQAATYRIILTPTK